MRPLLPSLSKDRAEGALRHVSGMVGNGGVAAALLVKPDFMASGRLAIESEAQSFEALYDLTIAETAQAPHTRR